jgi:hypothetical protein
MLDELDGPNRTLRDLLGVNETELAREDDIRFEKQDLPFARTVGAVELGASGSMPIFGARSRFDATSAMVTARFDDGSPAIAFRKLATGSATYLGFLPGLSYLRPALPRRPYQRGTTDDAMNHYLPTAFDERASALLESNDLHRPVVCSAALIESAIVAAKQGTIIPLINWSGAPARNLTVRVAARVPASEVRLASGSPVRAALEGAIHVFTLDLDVADAIILR